MFNINYPIDDLLTEHTNLSLFVFKIALTLNNGVLIQNFFDVIAMGLFKSFKGVVEVRKLLFNLLKIMITSKQARNFIGNGGYGR